MVRSSLLALCCCTAVMLQAQRPGGGRSGGMPGSSANPALHHSRDTLQVGYFYLDNPGEITPFDDTLMQGFHEFDLTTFDRHTFRNLGFPGSAVYPLLPIRQDPVVFHLGLNQFDPYRLGWSNLAFYNLTKAFTDARYTQGPSQEDGVFKLRFGRNFKDGIAMTIDYRRYNNTGLYSHQTLRNTNLGFGIRYQSKNDRFTLETIYSTNRFSQQENGGFTTDSLFNAQFSDTRLSIPVALNSAQTSDDSYDIDLIGRYRLLGDSVKAGVHLGYHFGFRDRRYLFFDDLPTDDYYGIFATDDRGLRQDLEHRQIDNRVFATLAGTDDQSALRVGLRAVAHRIDQAEMSETFMNWVAFGRASWQTTPWLRFNADLDLGVGAGAGTYLANATAQLDLGSAGYLLGRLGLSSTLPSRIAQQLFVSQDPIWSNDLRNQIRNHLSVTYGLNGRDIALTAGQLLLSQGIYWNSEGRVIQEEATASLTYLQLRARFRLGPLVSAHKIALQFTGNDNLFRVPIWHTESSLYLSGSIFKNILNVETGFDLRAFSETEGLTYHPLVGQFIHDDRFKIPVYPYLDYRFGFRVRYFRAFVKLENLLSLIRDDVSMQISRYPQQDFSLRIGIGWSFVN